MKRIFLLAVIVSLVLGCSTMTPARYSVSVDTRQTLKQYDGSLVYLEALEPPESYDPNCRLMGPIQAGDGLTIPEFIADAFNDEFKFAEIYDKKQGIKLNGKVVKIEFSSSKGLTRGYWDLYVTLNSPNGNTMSVGTHYMFDSGFDAITACNQTAQALGMAVQDLVYNAVTDHKFENLLVDQRQEKQELKATTEPAPAAKATDPPQEKPKLAVIPQKIAVAMVSLRRQPIELSNQTEITNMLIEYDFFDSSRNAYGAFVNDFVDNNDGTVTDKATGLMWQTGGSTGNLDRNGANKYIQQLNKQGFAGYSDWRLPTVEELASLLVRKRKDGVHLDPVFDNTRSTCWSVDKKEPENAWQLDGWIANFKQGQIQQAKYKNPSITMNYTPKLVNNMNYVKAVRSVR